MTPSAWAIFLIKAGSGRKRNLHVAGDVPDQPLLQIQGQFVSPGDLFRVAGDEEKPQVDSIAEEGSCKGLGQNRLDTRSDHNHRSDFHG